MTELTHSIVLFSGDDGLPLEFNVRNTNEKSLLKALIEHGGGVCTKSDNAVHLISPGTKVLNVDLGKKLVSSRYILDCVKQNYLLNVNDYVFTISEAQTSDISDEDSGKGLLAEISPEILNDKETVSSIVINTDISTTDEQMDYDISSFSTPSKSKSTQPKSTTASNLSESFVEGSQDTSRNPRIAAGVDIQTRECIPLTSTAKEPDSMNLPGNFDDIEKNLSPIQASASLVSPQKRTVAFADFEEKNAAKQLGTNSTKVLSPIRASPVRQQNETPFQGNSAKQIFSKDGDNLKGIEKGHDQNKGSAYCQSPQRRSDIIQASPTKNQKETSFQRNSAEHIFPKVDENSKSIRKSNDQNEELAYRPSPSKRNDSFLHYSSSGDSEDEMQVIPDVPEPPVRASPVHAAVSSSQQAMGDLDQFDNLLLDKAQQKAQSDNEDNLSQSYTVSSSADAQKTNSAEIFIADPSQLPDSPAQGEGQMNQYHSYIQRLEAEVENILQKPSPKSIQDKICLVKYICCVKKLSPAVVLQSLEKL